MSAISLQANNLTGMCDFAMHVSFGTVVVVVVMVVVETAVVVGQQLLDDGDLHAVVVVVYLKIVTLL